MTIRSRDAQPPFHRKTRDRRPHTRTYRVATTLAVSMLFLVAILVFVAIWGRQTPQPADASIAGRSADDMSSDASLASERPIYRHSVIAGGAYNPDDLASAMLQDAVVAEHYRGLVPNAVRPEIVTGDRLVYVSYRKDDRIYWTRNKVLLREGETILTDGTTQIRARCGNCISEKPMSPVSETEPDPFEFDRLVDDPDPLNPDPDGFVEAPGTLGAPWAQGGAQNSPTTAAPWISAQGPWAGDLASDPSALGTIADDPSQTSQVHPPPFALTAGNTPPGDPSPFTGDPSPTPGATPPPPDPPSSDGPIPPGLFDPLPGLDTNPFPDASDTPESVFDLDPPPSDNPPPSGPQPWGGGTEEGGGPYDTNPPVEPVNPVPVPEPGTILLVGGGAAITLFRKLRSRR